MTRRPADAAALGDSQLPHLCGCQRWNAIFDWLGAWSRLGACEEVGEQIAAEVVAEHAKGAWRVTEAASGFCGRELVEEIGAQGLVLALIEHRREVAGDSDLVFGNSVGRKLLGWDRFKQMVHRQSGTGDWHQHDLRRTGATLLGDMGIQPHIIEAVLNHVTQIASIYNRSRYLPEVTSALQVLADRIDDIEAGKSNVVAFPDAKMA